MARFWDLRHLDFRACLELRGSDFAIRLHKLLAQADIGRWALYCSGSRWIPFSHRCVYHVRTRVSLAGCLGRSLPAVGPEPREDRFSRHRRESPDTTCFVKYMLPNV